MVDVTVDQSDANGVAICADKKWDSWKSVYPQSSAMMWEAWKAVYPQSSAVMTSSQIGLVSWTASGLLLFPMLGMVAGAMVPTAMSSFGTVVAGVGTLHAPLMSGGCAAMLQASSAALVSVKAAAVGGFAGAITGVMSNFGRNSFGKFWQKKDA